MRPDSPSDFSLLRLGFAGLALFIPLGLASAQTARPSFKTDVLPIFERRCLVCHQGETPQKGLNLASAAGLLSGGASGPAVVPGNPQASLLLTKISGVKPAMPPVGEPLTPREIGFITGWIEVGAVDDSPNGDAAPGPTWWSLRPFQPAEPPSAQASWAAGRIDRFVLAKMQEKALSPSPAAGRRTLIRRLKFDLLGLPPTPEEIEQFAADTNPAAYEKLVDGYLEDPAYGERWGRHWLDVVRFGESNGYEQNHLRDNAWPYRDWVIRSLNEDKPFNRMILEQLAGDQIAPGDPSVEAATGFLVAGPHDTVTIQNPEGEAQKRANHLDDMVTATASAFLGLTVHCARCHDHKFDPIPQKDYYRMQSAFAGVWHGERPWATPDVIAAYDAEADPLKQEIRKADEALKAMRKSSNSRLEAIKEKVLASYRASVDPIRTEEEFEPLQARFVRLLIASSTASRNTVDLDEVEIWTTGDNARNIAREGKAAASSMRIDEASPDTYAAANLIDGKFDRRWISDSGFPQWIRIELPHVESIEKVAWSSDRLMGFGGHFGRATPESYELQVSLDGENWQTVADSNGRLPFSDSDRERLLLFAIFTPEERSRWTALEEQKRSAEGRLEALPKPARAFLGRFEQPKDPSFMMVRGNPMDHGEIIAPRSLKVLDATLPGYELAADEPEGERRLALAQWIASDGNALTARVIVNRIWMYHFGRPLVRNPSDFGINGGEPTHPELLEWLAARLVRKHGWKLKPLHREIVLSAAYRQASDFREEAAKIDRDADYLWRFPPRRLSAEEVRDAILSVSGSLDTSVGGPGFRLYRYTVDNVATYYPIEEFGPETFRRSVYHQHARSVKPELLGQFDCPDSSLPAPKRVSTTTPLQALSLLNNALLLEQARRLAERSLADAGGDTSARIERIWRLAFGRAPDPEEMERSRRFVSQQDWNLFSRAVLNANEFVYVF